MKEVEAHTNNLLFAQCVDNIRGTLYLIDNMLTLFANVFFERNAGLASVFLHRKKKSYFTIQMKKNSCSNLDRALNRGKTE